MSEETLLEFARRAVLVLANPPDVQPRATGEALHRMRGLTFGDGSIRCMLGLADDYWRFSFPTTARCSTGVEAVSVCVAEIARLSVRALE